MYNTKLLQDTMAIRGFNPNQLGIAAGVDRKTVVKVVYRGTGNPEKAFAIARALGLKVRRHDLSAIIVLDGPKEQKPVSSPARKTA